MADSIPTPTGAAQPPPTEQAACALCGSSESTWLYPLRDAVWRKPGSFGLRRCNGCGLCYLSPRPRQADIGFYYDELYEGEGLEFEEALQHGRIAGWINGARMTALRKRLVQVPSPRHLDVGCGVGGLCLQIVAKGVAAHATGVDFDPSAIESARARGADEPVEFHAGTLSEQHFDDGAFTSASMIHFLEHSYEPTTELREVHRVLEPGGSLVVEVPSATALGRKVYGNYWFPHLAPQHIVLFSRDTLRRALEEAGFENVEVKDCYAPLVWFSSFVLFYHHTLGGASKLAKSIPVRLFTVLFTLVAIIPMLLTDIALAILLPRIGKGDHIRATAAKP